MKVLFSQKISGISGSEKYFINIIPELQKKGIEIEFLSMYTSKQKTEKFDEIMRKFGVKTHQVSISGLSFFSAILKLARIIKQGDYSLVHSHLIHSDFILAFVKIIYGKFILVSTKHGYDEEYIQNSGLFLRDKPDGLYYYTAKFSERFIDRSFCVSHGLARLYSKFGITSYYPRVIWHGYFNPNESELRIEGVEDNRPYVLVLGRLVRFKGHKHLLDAFKLVLEKEPDIRLRIVGDGPLKMELTQHCKRLNIEKKVDFVGFKENVDHQIANSLFMVAPSIGEGFGLVILEAFNQKKPVIAFDVPAFNEIIEHGKNGLLVKPFSVSILAESIELLIQDTNYRLNLGENGYDTIAHNFSKIRCIDETIEFYQESCVIKNN